MENYKKIAGNFIVENQLTEADEIIGAVIYFYLLVVEKKTLAGYYEEANNYCYRLVDDRIGTLPKETIDRVTDEIMNSLICRCIAEEYEICLN